MPAAPILVQIDDTERPANAEEKTQIATIREASAFNQPTEPPAE